DMTTAATYGPGWIVPFSQPPMGSVAAASDQVWADDGVNFVRLAITLSAIPNQATLTPLVCATALPTPTIEPSPSPNAWPTASGTAAPTAEPTATPYAST
ncbi:MAG TPA: hypothetical protein VF337_12525, partial [Candidatus Limnocylindrales bacterium]